MDKIRRPQYSFYRIFDLATYNKLFEISNENKNILDVKITYAKFKIYILICLSLIDFVQMKNCDDCLLFGFGFDKYY